MIVARGVCEVCAMCMCLGRGCVCVEGGEWMRGLGLGVTNPAGTVYPISNVYKHTSSVDYTQNGMYNFYQYYHCKY